MITKSPVIKPKDYKYKIGDPVVINNKAKKDLPNDVGKIGYISGYAATSPNYDYFIEVHLESRKIKESEINSISSPDTYEVGDKVNYLINNQFAKVDEFYEVSKEVRLLFEDETSVTTHKSNVRKVIENEEEGEKVVKGNDYFQGKGSEIGSLVTKKQEAYGDSVGKAYKLMQIFLEDYDNGDNTYTIPKELLQHLLLQVRIIDKQNRIFSNPKGDLMSENPYGDTVGYGLLGMRMADEIASNNG
jgi:hypothetical protein